MINIMNNSFSAEFFGQSSLSLTVDFAFIFNDLFALTATIWWEGNSHCFLWEYITFWRDFRIPEIFAVEGGVYVSNSKWLNQLEKNEVKITNYLAFWISSGSLRPVEYLFELQTIFISIISIFLLASFSHQL